MGCKKLHAMVVIFLALAVPLLQSDDTGVATAQVKSAKSGTKNPLAPFTKLLGGKWIADEKQMTSDGRGYFPQITYESWFENKVIVATMHHLFDDGQAEMKWKAFNVWHPKKNKIVHYGFWANNMLIEGEFAEIVEGEPIELNFNVYWPPGSGSDLPTKWRSFGRQRDENTHTEEAYFYRDGKWVANITVTYRRQVDSGNEQRRKLL